MKKTLISALFVLVFGSSLFAADERYIVFFAETADIPQSVVTAILNSERFAINVPINSNDGIPSNLAELISYGKAEASLSFEPEPLFPVLVSINGDDSKPERLDVFKDYISNNVSGFSDKTFRKEFGLFLNTGGVSNSLLEYFSKQNFLWVNVSNLSDSLYGVYKIDKIPAFSMYKNFPDNKAEVMSWLSKRQETIIPVLLTRRQLNNYALMTYIIDLFDKSQYIKPATPLYIVKNQQSLIETNNDVSFKQVAVNKLVLDQLANAAYAIRKYKGSAKYKEYAYKSAQNELIYLSGSELISGLAEGKIASQRMFDAAYNNIFRLLGFSTQDSEEANKLKEKKDVYMTAEENSNMTASLITNGISVTNVGLIRKVSIISTTGNIVDIDIDFQGAWGENISFIDIYIDMNHIDGVGSTTMLRGVGGFLTPYSGWEYAIRMNKDKALLYRYATNTAVLVAEIELTGKSSVRIEKHIKGSPRNWGIQAIAVEQKDGKAEIVDYLERDTQLKAKVLSVVPVHVSGVRIKR